jgi:hypothetical protein
MLKKLAPPNETKNKKIKLLRNIERSFNNSLSYDTFRWFYNLSNRITNMLKIFNIILYDS